MVELQEHLPALSWHLHMRLDERYLIREENLKFATQVLLLVKKGENMFWRSRIPLRDILAATRINHGLSRNW